MRVHCLQHVPFEGPAYVENWVHDRGHRLDSTLVPRSPLPDLDAFDLLIVLGGPMSVHDERRYPWLGEEKAMLSAAIRADKGVLGICLGGQLVADVMGAKVVTSGEPEIGWHPVRLTPAGRRGRVTGVLPEEFEPFHWHGDTFGVPFGGVKAATSEACADQAFEAGGGRIVALQFHLESTIESVRALVDECPEDLVEAPYIQSPMEMLQDSRRFTRANRLAGRLLDAMDEAVSDR